MNAVQLARVRWAVRATLGLGVAASVAANVLHAADNLISQAISAWAPLALLLTVELISRIPVYNRWLAGGRLLATGTIAGIAAWVSYWHMAGVASRYGETGAAPYLIPFSVDGLIVVASICLVELGGRIRAVETPRATMVMDYDRPIGPMPSAQVTAYSPAPNSDQVRVPAGIDDDRASGVLSLTMPSEQPRKPQPTAQVRVERAHRRTPDASHAELAKRLGLSASTVRRWRPARAEQPAEPVVEA